MTKIELTPKLMVYTALLLLSFSAHLFSRVWVPLPEDDRTIEQFVPEGQVFQQPAADSLLQLLDGFASGDASNTDNPDAAQKYDGKQLGDLYVSLLGIYKVDQQLKAILQIQNKTENTKVLKRVGFDEHVEELHVLDLDIRHVRISYQQQDVTLVLFVKSN